MKQLYTKTGLTKEGIKHLLELFESRANPLQQEALIIEFKKHTEQREPDLTI